MPIINNRCLCDTFSKVLFNWDTFSKSYQRGSWSKVSQKRLIATNEKSTVLPPSMMSHLVVRIVLTVLRTNFDNPLESPNPVALRNSASTSTYKIYFVKYLFHNLFKVKRNRINREKCLKQYHECRRILSYPEILETNRHNRTE